MGIIFDDNFISRMGKASERHLIGHRPGWEKQPGRFSQQLGGHFLKFNDSGVVAKNIIANFGLRHRLPHTGRWFGYSI